MNVKLQEGDFRSSREMGTGSIKKIPKQEQKNRIHHPLGDFALGLEKIQESNPDTHRRAINVLNEVLGTSKGDIKTLYEAVFPDSGSRNFNHSDLIRMTNEYIDNNISVEKMPNDTDQQYAEMVNDRRIKYKKAILNVLELLYSGSIKG